jgi:exosome complex RNA-binding protein Csl4
MIKAVLIFIGKLFQNRCPKCDGRMKQVYGWNKMECERCNYTETYDTF